MKALADFLSYSTRSGCSASSLYAEATAKVLAVLRDCERVKSEPLDTQSTAAEGEGEGVTPRLRLRSPRAEAPPATTQSTMLPQLVPLSGGGGGGGGGIEVQIDYDKVNDNNVIVFSDT